MGSGVQIVSQSFENEEVFTIKKITNHPRYNPKRVGEDNRYFSFCIKTIVYVRRVSEKEALTRVMIFVSITWRQTLSWEKLRKWTTRIRPLTPGSGPPACPRMMRTLSSSLKKE